MLRHVRTLLTAAACLVALPLSAQVTRGKGPQDEIEAPEVKKLVLRGVKAVEKGELERSISVEESGCRSVLLKVFCLFTKSHYFYEREYLDRSEFERDVLRVKVFYYKRGYRETQVDTTVVKDKDEKVTVTFSVVEGPPTVVQKVTVQPLGDPLTARDIGRSVKVKAGKPYNFFQIDTTLTNLRDAMWEKGYGDASVDVKDAPGPVDSAHQATVTFTLIPKKRTTVGDLHIIGNDRVSEETIRNSLTFTEGEVYRLSDVTRSQRRLYQSNLFRSAQVRVVPPESAATYADAEDRARHQAGGFPDSAKTVLVVLREAPLRAARVSTGFNNVDYVQVEGRFTHYDWLGGPRQLDVQGTLGNVLAGQINGRLFFKDLTKINDLQVGETGRFLAPTWQGSADVRQRWFGNARNTAGLSVFAHRRSAPGVFIDRGYGTSISFTRETGLRSPLSGNYRFEITRVEAADVYFCINYGVCDVGTVGALAGNQRLSPFALTYSLNRSRNPLSPSQGLNAQVELEHASAFTISDFRYNRAYGEGAIYRPAWGGVVASRLRLGFVRALASTGEATGAGGANTILHPRKRFYAGGSQSVRGYGENQLGPRVLTIPERDLRGGYDTVVAAPTPTNPNNTTTITRYSLCDPAVEPDVRGCKPDTSALDNAVFTPRPLGGSRLIEANVEYRRRIWGALSGAVFVDGAVVGGGAAGDALERNLLKATGAITPGFGIRYQSPVGPIRVDVGFNPQIEENLRVITDQEIDPVTHRRELVELRDSEGRPVTRRYKRPDGWLNALTIHLSIGEAF